MRVDHRIEPTLFWEKRHRRVADRRRIFRPAGHCEEVRFALDSLLEEGVTSEPVSEARKFPASRENTGNFIDSCPAAGLMAAKKGVNPEAYRPIPYAPEQGIFCGLAGN
jgi:hypothetical protein